MTVIDGILHEIMILRNEGLKELTLIDKELKKSNTLKLLEIQVQHAMFMSEVFKRSDDEMYVEKMSPFVDRLNASMNAIYDSMKEES